MIAGKPTAVRRASCSFAASIALTIAETSRAFSSVASSSRERSTKRWPGCRGSATPSPSHRESRNVDRSFDIDIRRVLTCSF